VKICIILYGPPCRQDKSFTPPLARDILSVSGKMSSSDYESAAVPPSAGPGNDVFRLTLVEMVSPHAMCRLAVRFLLGNYVLTPFSKSAQPKFMDYLSLIRRLVFGRSLRLMPVAQQTGIIEGLALLMQVSVLL